MAGDPKLTKEVLPPQKQSSGLGVMVVAATAMFFAVASSAFILRARMAQSYCGDAQATPVVIELESPPAATNQATTDEPTVVKDCGAATVEKNSDGTETYYFEPCNEPIPTIVGEQPAAKSILIHDVHTD